MNHRVLLPLVALALAFLLPRSAGAQVDALVVDPSGDVGVGTAVVAQIPGGVEVCNIGDNGLDGVGIDLDAALSWSADVAFTEPLADDRVVTIGTRGAVGPIDNRPLVQLGIETLESGLRFRGQAASPLPGVATLEVLAGDDVVHHEESQFLQDVELVFNWASPDYEPNGDLAASADSCDGVETVIDMPLPGVTGLIANGTPVDGDRVRVTCRIDNFFVRAITGFDITGINTPCFTMTNAKYVPGLIQAGLRHSPVGSASLTLAGAGLSISGLESRDTDAVVIAGGSCDGAGGGWIGWQSQQQVRIPDQGSILIGGILAPAPVADGLGAGLVGTDQSFHTDLSILQDDRVLATFAVGDGVPVAGPEIVQLRSGGDLVQAVTAPEDLDVSYSYMQSPTPDPELVYRVNFFRGPGDKVILLRELSFFSADNWEMLVSGQSYVGDSLRVLTPLDTGAVQAIAKMVVSGDGSPTVTMGQRSAVSGTLFDGVPSSARGSARVRRTADGLHVTDFDPQEGGGVAFDTADVEGSSTASAVEVDLDVAGLGNPGAELEVVAAGSHALAMRRAGSEPQGFFDSFFDLTDFVAGNEGSGAGALEVQVGVLDDGALAGSAVVAPGEEGRIGSLGGDAVFQRVRVTRASVRLMFAENVTFTAVGQAPLEGNELRVRRLDRAVASLMGVEILARNIESFDITAIRSVLGDPFLRGDCDGDGDACSGVNDALTMLSWLFRGDTRPPCVAACDANGDGETELTDAVYGLDYCFTGTASPPAPFPECGTGTEADAALGCVTTPGICQ